MKVCEAAPPRFPQPHLTGVLPGLPRRNHLCSPATDLSTDSQAILPGVSINPENLITSWPSL